LRLEFSGFRNLLLAAFTISACAVIVSAVRLIPLKADVTNPESANLAGPVAGPSAPLYPDINQPPYTPSPYGPLFYSTVKFMAHATGNQIERVRTACRVFVFVMFLLLPVGVYLLLRAVALSRILAALGALASISFYYMPGFAAAMKPDIPALCLSVFALWFACHRPDPNRLDLVLSGFVCVAALMFKESFAAAPLAIGAVLLTQKRYKNLSVFAVSVVVAAVVFLDVIFRGDPVIRQLLLVGETPKSLRSAVTLIHLYLPTGFGSLLLPAACAGFLLGVRSTEWRLRLYSYYFLFAVMIGFTTLLQCGAGVYYFFELWVAGALLLPPVLLRIRDSWNDADWPVQLVASLIVVFLLVQQVHAIRESTRDVHDFNVAKLHALHILSTDPYFAVQGRDPVLLDSWLSSILEKKHRWSPEPILAEIRQQNFDLVFIHEINHAPLLYRTLDLIGPAIDEEIRANYRPLCWTSGFVILRPLRRQIMFTPDDASEVLAERCYSTDDTTF